MVDEVIETQKSKWAKSKLMKMLEDGEIHKDSPEGLNIKGISYLSEYRERFFKENQFDATSLSELLIRMDEPRYSLLKYSVKLNLDETQISECIKIFIRNSYGSPYPGRKDSLNAKNWLLTGRDSGKRVYQDFCKYFELNPESGFPDW
jgi:hypothetical protein